MDFDSILSSLNNDICNTINNSTYDIITHFHYLSSDIHSELSFLNRKLNEIIPFLVLSGFSHLEKKDNTFIIYINF